MQTEAATKVEPMARIMRVGDHLVVAKKDHRIIFESPDEPNTTVVPVIGVLLEFDEAPVVHVMLNPTGGPRCIFLQVWLSSVTGDRKDVLEFKDFLVYLEQVKLGQKVRVLKMP